MKRPATLLACSLLLLGHSAAGPQEAPSFVNDAIVQAPVAAVWKVFSTPAGYKLLGVAQVDMDFRIGGLIRSSYAAHGTLGDADTIENRILAYEPQRMLAIAIERAPQAFPYREAWKHTWTVITLTRVRENATLVHIASMGFGTDEESTAMRHFFEKGNAATLKLLQQKLPVAPQE
jgi:uncharacterized protein YndB with AHSA1/START domain